jgi:hypothetical protein
MEEAVIKVVEEMAAAAAAAAAAASTATASSATQKPVSGGGKLCWMHAWRKPRNWQLQVRLYWITLPTATAALSTIAISNLFFQ